MIMPIDIDKKEFSRDKKGYNSREVDEFLDIIVADYEKVLNDNRTMAHKIKALEKQLEEAWHAASEDMSRAAQGGAQQGPQGGNPFGGQQGPQGGQGGPGPDYGNDKPDEQ